MEDALRKLYEHTDVMKDALGILLIQKEDGLENVTNFQDAILLVIKESQEKQWISDQFFIEGKKVTIHLVREDLCKKWIITGENPRFIDWIFNGKILYQSDQLICIKNCVRELSSADKERKIGIEYARLVCHREAGKSLYKTKNYLDAFHHMLQALSHQARLSVIEKGFFPEVTVWKQVKYIEPETYKLYQELLAGEEILAKKIELVMLATEFAISSKVKIGSSHFLKVMKKRNMPMTIGDLMNEEELQEYQIELEILIEHLIEKGMIEIVTESKYSKNKRLYKVVSL